MGLLREGPKKGAHALESIAVPAASSKLSLALAQVFLGDEELSWDCLKKNFL